MKCKKAICSAVMSVLIFSCSAVRADYTFSNDYGDYLYFDSTQLNNAAAKYNNFTATENENYIALGRLDYKNADRDDRIYMEKSSDSECKISVALKKNQNTYSTAAYSYYVVEGVLMSDIFTSDLGITLSDSEGKSLKITLSCTENDLSEETDFKIYADFKNKSVKLYIAGKEEQSLGLGALVSFSALDIELSGKRGNMYIDKLKITGMVKPLTDVYTKSDIFGDFTSESEFLKDKTVICAGINRLLKKGIFIKAEHTPFFKDDDVYISTGDFKNLFGKEAAAAANAIYTDGVLYVPAAQLSRVQLGENASVHKTAEAVFIADEETGLGSKTWQYYAYRNDTRISLFNDIDFIINYMTFERPDAPKIHTDFTKENVHPRLMLSAEKVLRLKMLQKEDERFFALSKAFITEAESTLSEPIAKYSFSDDLRMKSEADKCIRRIMNWGLAWNLTGEGKYTERAWQDLSAIANFPDYNLATIHDSAEFNAALAIGYDWFYNGFTPKQRSLLEDAILNHSLKPLADGYYGRIFAGGNDWSSFKWASNLNSVANAGVILAAAAVFEKDAEYCADVISKALRSLEYTMTMFAPDGGWNEGTGYWDYAMTYLCSAVETLDNVFGSDYGLSGARGFKATVDFHISMAGVCGVNNFGDCAPKEEKTVSVYSMMSDICNDGRYINGRIDEITQKGLSPYAEDIIFYPSVLCESTKKDASAVKIRGVEGFSTGVGGDENSMYFSTHFGRTSGYHTHNDTGTFVLDMLGERWAEDLGAESYALENFEGYKGWQLYRKRAEGHNCLVINPSADSYEQLQNKFVPIKKCDYNQTSAYVCADMSDIYKDAKKVMLGYYAENNLKSLSCVYEIATENKENMYWFMHTKADIRIDGNTAFLTKNQKTVKVIFELCGADYYKLEKAEAKSLFAGLDAGNKNTQYSKLALSFEGSGEMCLKIIIAPENAEVQFPKESIDNWKLN